MNEVKCSSDFEYQAENADAAINYIHRVLDNGTDIYFIANHQRRAETFYAAFRKEGKIPELWNPETGERRNAVDYFHANDKTWVPIQLEEAGSVFVVFHQKGKVPKGKQPDGTPYSPKDADENGNFTITAWIKLETNIVMPVEDPKRMNNDFGKGFTVYPHRADLIYGKGHSGSGFAVGINGISVFEKSDEVYAAILISPQKIEGWTHVAIVYRDGIPELYINGDFIKKGISSGLKSHSRVSYPHKGKEIPYSESDFTKIDHHKGVLSKSEIVSTL